MNKPGFSLVEIMIVILIIGVLAAGTIGGLRWLQRAKLTNTETKLMQGDTMLEEYNNRIGEYPSELRELIDGPQKPESRKKWALPIADENSLKDGWNYPFVYILNPKGSKIPYELYSTGPKQTDQIFSPASRES